MTPVWCAGDYSVSPGYRRSFFDPVNSAVSDWFLGAATNLGESRFLFLRQALDDLVFRVRDTEKTLPDQVFLLSNGSRWAGIASPNRQASGNYYRASGFPEMVHLASRRSLIHPIVRTCLQSIFPLRMGADGGHSGMTSSGAAGTA